MTSSFSKKAFLSLKKNSLDRFSFKRIRIRFRISEKFAAANPSRVSFLWTLYRASSEFGQELKIATIQKRKAASLRFFENQVWNRKRNEREEKQQKEKRETKRKDRLTYFSNYFFSIFKNTFVRRSFPYRANSVRSIGFSFRIRQRYFRTAHRKSE